MKRAEKLILARQKKLEENIENEFGGMCFWLKYQKSINQYEANVLLNFISTNKHILENKMLGKYNEIYNYLYKISMTNQTYKYNNKDTFMSIYIDTATLSVDISTNDIVGLFSEIEFHSQLYTHEYYVFIGILKIIFADKNIDNNLIDNLYKLYDFFQDRKYSYPTHILYNLLPQKEIITIIEEEPIEELNLKNKLINFFKANKEKSKNDITKVTQTITTYNIDNSSLIYDVIKKLISNNFPENDGLSFIDKLPLDNPQPEIEIKKKIFYLTGEFNCGKAYCCDEIELQGGSITTRMENTVNYLLVGSIGNFDWEETPTGKRIKKVLSMKEKGINIAIISEDDFLKKALSFNPIVK